MFLCNDCHDHSNCHAGWIEDFQRSRGSCEMCRVQASCYDCHGYNFSATAGSREYAQNVARPAEQPTGDEHIAPKCTCESFGNGVVSGNDGRLVPAEGCPRHGEAWT